MAADQAGSDREPVTSPALDQAPLTFQAFSKLPATEREALTPLTDTELAVIEGSRVDVCILCLNAAVVDQVNAALVAGVGVGGSWVVVAWYWCRGPAIQRGSGRPEHQLN